MGLIYKIIFYFFSAGTWGYFMEKINVTRDKIKVYGQRPLIRYRKFTQMAVLVILVWVLGFFSPVSAGGLRVGMNLNSVEDWMPDHVFVDVFKKSRDWVTRNADGSGAWDSGKEIFIPRDDSGWPTEVPFSPSDGSPSQIVHTLVTVLQGGTYMMYYKGQGTFTVGGSGAGYQVVCADVSGEKTVPVEVSLDHDGQGVIWLSIQSTRADDYLRDFRMITPGFDAATLSDPFYPDYKEKLAPFSILRFMDWGRINASPVQSWSDRTRLDHATQARKSGVALEYMVRLANDLNKSLWICIPHKADDDFVEKTAQLLKETVSPKLKIYVEYSNETWNTAYPFGSDGLGQTDWVQDQGIAMGFDDDSWKAGQKYTVYRSARIWKIFEMVFGSEGADRLIKVLATQSAGLSVTELRLASVLDPAVNPFNVAPDVLAIAPYFGGGLADELVAEGVVETITVPEILGRAGDHLREAISVDLAGQKEQADLNNLWLVTYEGGQHLAGTLGNENNEVLTAKLISANRDSGMYELYLEYLDMLHETGVALFNSFSFISEPSKWGSWGVLESISQENDTAPKYLALTQWMAANVPSNSAPRARPVAGIVVTDTDGDGEEPVNLDGTRSRDLDGTVKQYTWYESGTEVAVGPTAIITFPVGMHTLDLEVEDNEGATDRKTFQVLIESGKAVPSVLVTSDFMGVSPANHTPWAKFENLSQGLNYGGWKLGPGVVKSDRDDVFAYFVNNPAALSTLAEAVAADQYASVSLSPKPGYVLDLSNALFQLTVRRFDNHGGHRYAIFSSVHGFDVGQELFVSDYFDSWHTEDAVIDFRLPVEGFANVEGDVEFRLYPFEAQYHHKETSVAAFVLQGHVR